MERVYLDYNASTPLAPEVVKTMEPFLKDYYGNPSASHWAGEKALSAYEGSRKQIADLLGCDPAEIVFTSGGSESNNFALKGVVNDLRNRGNHIITTSIEHPAIITPCEFLKQQNIMTTYVGVDHEGRVSPADIEKAITSTTILISVMHANNETGVIQPVGEIARIAHKYGLLMHSDAAQSVGKIPVKVDELGVDLLSLAGHKLYAPKGIGVLYVKEGTYLEPLIHGAGHERKMRAGTENVLLALGLGKACELAETNPVTSHMENLRDYFWQELQQLFSGQIVLNGHPQLRLPNTLYVSFLGRTGQEVLDQIPGVAATTGSACHTGSVELSPVLKAMHVSEEIGKGAVRFSLGRYTTKEEIDLALEWLSRIK